MTDKLKFSIVSSINKDNFLELVSTTQDAIAFMQESLDKHGSYSDYDCMSVFKRQKTVEFSRLFVACITMGSTKYLEDSDLMDDLFSIYYTIVVTSHRTLARYNITRNTADYIYAFLLLHGDGQFGLFKTNIGTFFSPFKFVSAIKDILSKCDETSITLANNFIYLLPSAHNVFKLTLESYWYIPTIIESEILTLNTITDRKTNIILYTEEGKAIAEYRQNFNFYTVDENNNVKRLLEGYNEDNVY